MVAASEALVALDDYPHTTTIQGEEWIGPIVAAAMEHLEWVRDPVGDARPGKRRETVPASARNAAVWMAASDHRQASTHEVMIGLLIRSCETRACLLVLGAGSAV